MKLKIKARAGAAKAKVAKDRKAAVYAAVLGILTILILAGLVVMAITSNFTKLILWLEMGCGFIWSSMLALQYLPAKRRGWFFAILAMVLALILLDGFLNFIEY